MSRSLELSEEDYARLQRAAEAEGDHARRVDRAASADVPRSSAGHERKAGEDPG